MHFSFSFLLALFVTSPFVTSPFATSQFVFAKPLNAKPLNAKVFSDGAKPRDQRLQPLKDLRGHFPFAVPESKSSWEQRAEELRRRILVATGIWPLPDRTPLNAVIHGKMERDGYTIEKVYFESIPGHFVTGLLFRPEKTSQKAAGKRPAVLSPHGHGGRLHDYGLETVKKMIARGEEQFEVSGRTPKITRCVQLARMGCVVFLYDMLGYTDSQQIPRKIAHGYRETRPGMDTAENWGFFSTQAELRLQSIMGVQTWNSVRALDFLESLPDVDATRLAVTGGSGGGTQTILLCAIDKRPIVAFPQGMVSTSMQGGCTCENCSLLRIGTGNVELAALFAPKPQAMTAADDWTHAMMEDGYPELQKLYGMVGDKDDVFCKAFPKFPHNYNYVTRSIMYSWFNKHLQLGLEEPILEEDSKHLSVSDQRVWDDEHPRPPGGEAYERKLTKQLDDASNALLTKIRPTDPPSWEHYQHIVGGAVQTLIGRGMPAYEDLQRTKVSKKKQDDYVFFTDIVRLKSQNEELPIVSFYPKSTHPKSTKWNSKVVLWFDGNGKQALFDDKQNPISEIRQLLKAGYAVVSADLLYQGEFLDADQTFPETPTVKNPRPFAGYTHGYNHSVFANRVHDILTLITYVKGGEQTPESIALVGMNGAGPLVAAARAIAGNLVDHAAIATDGFRFTHLKSYRAPDFLPGITKYGDLPGLLSLSAPNALWIAGEGESLPEIVAATYQATGAKNRLFQAASQVSTGPSNPSQAAVEWLLSQ